MEIAPTFLILGQGHEGGDDFLLVERQQVDHGLTARLRRAQRQAIDLFLIDDAAGREEQHRCMGVDHEDLANEILIPGAHAGTSLAATALGAIGIERYPLDVTVMTYGHHHVLALDQVFDIEIDTGFDQLGTPRVGELLFHGQQLIAQNPAQNFARAEDRQVFLDLIADLAQFRGDLVALQPGQAMQTKLKNGPGLGFR